MKLIETTCQKEGEWSPWVKIGDTVWYILTVSWDESQKAKEIAKSAGFNFSGRKNEKGIWEGKKLWYTNDFDKAAKLADYAIGDCRKKLTERQVMLTTSLADSKKASTLMEFPHPEGIDYFPFQKAGIEYCIKRPPEIKGTIIGDEPGVGKEQPVSEPVLTESGWVKIGDLKVGDTVIGSDGQSKKVIGVFPQGLKDVYELTFTDRTKVRCGIDHLWTVRDGNMATRGKGWQTISLQRMIERGILLKSGKGKFEVPKVQTAVFKRGYNLPIDPYQMGAIIANGSCCDCSIVVTVNENDTDVMDRIDRDKSRWEKRKGCCRTALRGLKPIIRSFGLEVTSAFKFIPEAYKYASIYERIHLLQGLMDGDGSNQDNRITYHTCSIQLAEDVAELVRSLGGCAVVREYKRFSTGATEIQVNVKTDFNPFFSKRKSAGWKRDDRTIGHKIVEVKCVGKEESVCIMVDSEDHLYVTNGYKLTHNTIQAIGVYNTVSEIKTCLIICPAKLKFNWKREFNKWKTKACKVAVADTKTVPLPEHGFDVVITNYDSLPKINRKLADIDWDLLIVDEAHNYRNVGTQRWESFRGSQDSGWLPINGKRLLLLTGTPIVNRPKELWNLISLVDPEKWNSRTAYMYLKRYCGAQRTEYGFNAKGHGEDDKLSELQTVLRQRCMIRRLKADVLTELPAKIKQVVTLEYDENDIVAKSALEHEKMYKRHNENDMVEAAVRAELAKAGDNEDEYRNAIESIVNENRVQFAEMAKIRHETAVAKIPYAIDYVEGLLESESKIVVFAHHKDVLNAFAKKFTLNSVTIDGETSPQNTQLRVDRFQTDENCNVALISIQAGGVGLTLTAANYGVFVELDWVPGINNQAGDRLHRIGQLKTVYLMFLVLENSIDAHIAQTCVEKQEVIDKVLDGNYEAPVILTRDNAATKNTSRAKIAEQATKISNWQILYVHQALKFLANDDGDYARGVNGIGYNKIDTAIGHSLADRETLTPKQGVLAMKIVKKYKRQLPEDLYNKIFVRSGTDESEGW